MPRRFMIPLLSAVLALGLLAAPAAGSPDGPPGLDRALERVQNDRARAAIEAAQDRHRDRDRGPATPTTITLLHDTHFHGKFASSEAATIGRYFALVQERKDRLGDGAFFVGNGDDVAPSLLSGVFEPHGIHMVEALNEAPIDLTTLGNHEFDFGPANLRALLEVAEYPYVTANVRDAETGEVFGKELGVEEFILRSVGDVTVGFTGLAPENMASITSLGDEAVQIPALQALQQVVPDMRAAGADIVVVASHLCGTDAIDIADRYDGVDVFVGDHCAQVLDEPYVSDNGTIVSLAGHEFNELGELTLTYRDGEITGHRYVLHELDADRYRHLEPLPGVQAVVDRYEAQLDEQLNVVIGEKTVTWDTRVGEVRTSENAFGNFLTDEMRAFHDADIAVQNSGGIRADRIFDDAEVTRRDIAEILPFANHLVKAEISGATLLAALERSVDTYPATSGAFLQVSGMSFTFDPSQPVGQRVVEVMIGGELLDPDRTYTMATNDFTLGGGDAYDMFRDETVTLVGANEGPLLSTFLINRIEARTEPITTDIEGRITPLG
jgi:5'-nucleotidase / UDP-sugar diphosphatase